MAGSRETVPGDGLEELRARVAAGLPIGRTDRLPPDLAGRLDLAERLGAPLLPELDLALADRAAAAELAAEVRVATAQGRAVATGLVAAPVVLVPALGRLLGLDLLGFYASPPGRLVLAGAVAMHLLGVLWVRALLRPRDRGVGGGWGLRVVVAVLFAWLAHPAAALGALLVPRASGQRAGDDPAVVELVAVAVRGGVDLPTALRTAGEVVPERARELGRLALQLDLGAPPTATALPRLAAVVRAAAEHGTPVAAGLGRLVADLRREERTRAREAAARLPALLTPPTALLILPASLLAVGAPLVAEALRTVQG